MSSNPYELTIIVDNCEINDILFTWDLLTNTENEAYDVGKNYELIYDSMGYLYIIKECGLVYFTSQGCATKCYGVIMDRDCTDCQRK